MNMFIAWTYRLRGSIRFLPSSLYQRDSDGEDKDEEKFFLSLRDSTIYIEAVCWLVAQDEIQEARRLLCFGVHAD